MTAPVAFDVTLPSQRPESPVYARMFDAAQAWRSRAGHWPAAFVTSMGGDPRDLRVESVIDRLLACGFAIHRAPGAQSFESALAGVQAVQPPLVLIGTPGPKGERALRRLVLALSEVDYILVAGEKPLESEREGDQGARLTHVDALNQGADLLRDLQFIMRGLEILPR